MKKIFAVLIFILAFATALAACSNDEIPAESGAQSSEEDYRCEGDCVVIDDVSEAEKPQEHQEKPTFEDMDSIYLFDEDDSPLIAMTEEERAEFLEIIDSYELTEIDGADPAIGTMDRNITFKSREKGAVLYSKELAGKGLLSLKWNDWQSSVLYDVSGDLYYDLEDFRHQIQKMPAPTEDGLSSALRKSLTHIRIILRNLTRNIFSKNWILSFSAFPGNSALNKTALIPKKPGFSAL